MREIRKYFSPQTYGTAVNMISPRTDKYKRIRLHKNMIKKRSAFLKLSVITVTVLLKSIHNADISTEPYADSQCLDSNRMLTCRMSQFIKSPTEGQECLALMNELF